ncbi:MAG: TIM barrel protein [Planctomycetia bacterium]|nr:TIM barrel protein [Planctomycetia bacterium]
MHSGHLNRRQMLSRTAGIAAACGIGIGSAATGAGDEQSAPAVTKGRIRQSVVQWCFGKHWKIEETCQVAKKLGIPSVELVNPRDWPILKQHGLKCAIASSHPFDKGMNNPKHQPMCFEKLRAAIDASSEFGCPSVITFTGFREDIPDDVGMKNCVAGFKQIVGYAEQKKVTLCLEMLNSRVNEEMKGHPGYQGDHTDYCVEIIKQVGSPRFKLLFDIYHVQIMEGDIITRIRQYHEYIGHYHTAGNPGRRELDAKQEINYPPIMEEIVKTGYQGFVGQEFIPTRDPLEGLTEAVRVCDV